MREGFEGVFFGATREGVEKFGRDTRGFEMRGLEATGVPGTWLETVVLVDCCRPLPLETSSLVASSAAFGVIGAEAWTSGGSDDGGSSPMLGFNGVRKGDLNGFWSVFVASFNRRRFACGVDIFAALGALECSGITCKAVLDVVSAVRIAMSSDPSDFRTCGLANRAVTLSRALTACTKAEAYSIERDVMFAHIRIELPEFLWFTLSVLKVVIMYQPHLVQMLY